ncbi:MAG: hypothetical protein ACKVZJ_11180 [Phycisphaerales bacterium]
MIRYRVGESLIGCLLYVVVPVLSLTSGCVVALAGAWCLDQLGFSGVGWGWLLVLLFILGFALPMTVLSLVHPRLGRRYRPLSHCQACGYDLADIRSGVCPECGKPFHAALARSVSRLMRSQASKRKRSK